MKLKLTVIFILTAIMSFGQIVKNQDWEFNQRVSIAGALKYTYGTPINGYVLTTDGSGNATWQIAGNASGWSLIGNSGTDTSINFVGTTDSKPLVFRLNSQRSGLISPSGAVFLGYQSGGSNTAISSIGIGYKALFSNTSGQNNKAFGYQALYSNTTGYSNTAIGDAALFSNNGNSNVAVGYNVLSANTSGGANVAVGATSMQASVSGNYNTAVGYGSMSAHKSQNENVAIGYESMYLDTQGFYNVAVGSQALSGSAFTYESVAVGQRALPNLTTGYQNTAVGFQAGQGIQSGIRNVIVGYGADVVAGTENNVVAIGRQATASDSSIALGSMAFAEPNQFAIPSFITRVRFGSLPEYANDAAAGVGGLAAGELYQTTSAGSSVVKIKQ